MKMRCGGFIKPWASEALVAPDPTAIVVRHGCGMFRVMRSSRLSWRCSGTGWGNVAARRQEKSLQPFAPICGHAEADLYAGGGIRIGTSAQTEAGAVAPAHLSGCEIG